jgi:hypothetical protein
LDEFDRETRGCLPDIQSSILELVKRNSVADAPERTKDRTATAKCRGDDKFLFTTVGRARIN